MGFQHPELLRRNGIRTSRLDGILQRGAGVRQLLNTGKKPFQFLRRQRGRRPAADIDRRGRPSGTALLQKAPVFPEHRSDVFPGPLLPGPVGTGGKRAVQEDRRTERNVEIEAPGILRKIDAFQELPLRLRDLKRETAFFRCHKIVFHKERADLFVGTTLFQHSHRDLGRADPGERPPGQPDPGEIGKRPVELPLQGVFCCLPVFIGRDLHAKEEIPFYPAFIRIRVCIDRHLVLWKEALDQGVDIIQKILPVQLNSDIQRANPSMILSSLMVVVLPWPGRTCTSSGSVVRSVVSDSRRSRTEPVGRSYLP